DVLALSGRRPARRVRPRQPLGGALPAGRFERSLPAELPIVVTATRLEARAVRRALPGAPAVRAGVGLTRLQGALGGPVVTCGLAGARWGGPPVGAGGGPRGRLRPGRGGGWG